MQYTVRLDIPSTTIFVTIESVISKAAGKRQDDTQRIYMQLGKELAHEWFSMTSEYFDIKASGGTAPDNIKWKKNNRRYIAYGKEGKTKRRGRGQMPNNFIGGPSTDGKLGRGSGTGELNSEALKEWWAIYMPLRNHYRSLGMPLATAKARAAAATWNKMKAFGVKTKFETMGRRKTKIGVSRGHLQRSLLPGSRPTETPDNPHQIKDIQPGVIRVGTNLSYSDHFHRRRKLWPQFWTTKMAERMRGRASDVLARLIAEGLK